MSFTIKCDKCGNERVFTDRSRKYEKDSICINVFTSSSYNEMKVDSIDIDCHNPNCDAGIVIDY